MKKMVLVLFVIVLAASLIVSGGGKKTEKEERMVEDEFAGVGLDEVDPWILEMREGLDQYRGEIRYKGPLGETPTWDTELVLTVREVKKIRKGDYKVAYVMDGSHADHTTSMVKGMRETLEHLGMELVSVYDPVYDAAKEREGVESVMALDPDVVVCGPIDPIVSGESFRLVIEAGKKLVIWSNVPQGYEYGRDYVGVSSAMAQDLGVFTVDLLKKETSGKTEVAFFYFDANFWVVNLIDSMVKEALEKDPNLVIVEERGYSKDSDVFDLMTAAINRHPNIKRVYAGWMVPASYAADAAAQAGRDDIKVACFGVDRPTLASILTGGNFIGTVSDDPYHLGANLAILAGYGVIEKDAPRFTITPAVPITAESLEDVWAVTQKTPFPEEIGKLLK
jgi:ribose transport system substrate-binding protein